MGNWSQQSWKRACFQMQPSRESPKKVTAHCNLEKKRNVTREQSCADNRDLALCEGSVRAP